jgi:hypothetical protein
MSLIKWRVAFRGFRRWTYANQASMERNHLEPVKRHCRREHLRLRPVVRTFQRIAKEAMLGFIVIGAIILFAASWRRTVFISIVPLY